MNELESRQQELQARIAASDRAALDYVKTLSGFKKAYPQFAAEYAEAKGELEEAEAEAVELRKEWEYRAMRREWLKPGDEVVDEGVTCVVVIGHNAQLDWKPKDTPALFSRKDDPGDEWPEIPETIDAQHAWMKGKGGTWKGEHYVSLIDYNVWNPDQYPAGWQKQ